MCLLNDYGAVIKYEEVYLHAYASVKNANDQIGTWLDYYNQKRRHSNLSTQRHG